MVPLISFRAVYKGGDVTYFVGNEYFSVVAILICSLLAFLGLLISYLDHQERDKASKEKDQSINWFSTLVNLVAHNLRSPLATILGSAQVIQAKYPSVYQSRSLSEFKTLRPSTKSLIDC